MTVLYNLAKVATATTGTGTITLGSAVSGYLTFAQSGVQNGDVVAYGIRDGVNSEVGTGTYSSTGPTLTRSVTKSTNSNNPISLSGSAEVYITARSEDIVNKTGDTMTGALTLLNTGLKVQDTDASHTLSIIPGTNLTADRTLTWTTGDTSRNITLTGNTTIPATFPTSTTDNTVPRFDGAAGSFQTSGVAIDDSNNVTGVLSIDIGGTDTTITKASSGVIAVEGSNVLMASNIGSSVQAYSANLASLSSVYTAPAPTTSAQFNLLEATNNGTNYLTLLPPTSIASNKNVSFQDVAGTVYVSNGTDVALTDGGTGASSASDARTNLGCGDGTVTGSGSLVLANSPTLSTPTLGTPLSGTLTNCTGLPISTGVSGLGANVATFLATPSSANLASAVTDETGSGALVFATSPSLTTPALSGETFSTSAAVTAGTNAQGQGALTSDYNVITTASSNPSGVTLPTATTGRRVVIVNKGANPVNVYPASGGTIDALSANASIQVPVAGVMEFNASSTTQWYSSYNLTTNTISGTVGVSNGGTGQTSLTANNVILGNGTSAVQFVAPSTSGNVLTSDGTTWSSSTALPRASAVNSTSGTSIDFTGIPSWVKRITVMLNQVSTNGSSAVLVRVGTSGGVVASGYIGGSGTISSSPGVNTSTTGFSIGGASAGDTRSGFIIINNLSGNIWVCCGSSSNGNSPTQIYAHNYLIDAGGTLDRIRITTANGTDTFDNGSINILYE